MIKQCIAIVLLLPLLCVFGACEWGLILEILCFVLAVPLLGGMWWAVKDSNG